MQVKKFEANTMGEALELVKYSFGPEAVILSTKDNSKRFGLAGSQSVEVTAAISEDTLKKKQYAEKLLNEKNKKSFTAMTATHQKEFINKSIARLEEPEEKKEITSRRYIDIDDEQAASHEINEDSIQRIKSAATRAFEAANNNKDLFFEETKAVQAKPEVRPSGDKDLEISNLKNEISSLKEMVQNFQNVPQSFISLHPGAEENIPYEFSSLYNKLINSGLEKPLIKTIVEAAKKELTPDMQKKPGIVDGWCAQYILKTTQVFKPENSKKFQFFVGPTGQGKTSTLVKLASQYVVYQKKKVAIITTDTKKVGSIEQLRIFSKILNVAFGVIRTKADWDRLLPKLAGFDYVLVDTAGSQLKGSADFDTIRSLIPKDKIDYQMHYVQSVLFNSEVSKKVASSYKLLGITDSIFTHLDEPAQFGSVYNFQRKFNVPLHSFSIGPAIPEDYEFATKERVLDLIFNITKISKGSRSHG